MSTNGVAFSADQLRERLNDPKVAHELNRMLDHLDIISFAVEFASKPVEPVGGLFATLKATKDPDVQKSVGFFFAFAKAFAKHLK